jgi:hypothetical protein
VIRRGLSGLLARPLGVLGCALDLQARPLGLLGCVVGSLAAGAAGCHQEPQATPVIAAVSAAPSAPALPVDYQLPGELGEGSEKTFGLILPRRFAVRARFEHASSSFGDASPEQVSNYIRHRVEAATVEVGPARTIFQAAKIKGQASAPLLRIEIADAPGGAEIVVTDLSPAPVVPGLTEEERWRRQGLRPDGRLLDPTKAF